MTQEERDRLVTLKPARKGRITQRKAAEERKLGERQVRRLLEKLQKRGDKAVIHGMVGRRSNRRIEEAIQQKAVRILSADVCRGFAPTFASEHRSGKHGIEVSRETVRKWMIGAQPGRAKKEGVEPVHPWRERRSRFGGLVQWDASEPDWLEGRAGSCT
ncbi:MAG: hypothetical protein ACRETL_15960 [Gammaproteobacteria bacterium]